MRLGEQVQEERDGGGWGQDDEALYLSDRDTWKTRSYQHSSIGVSHGDMDTNRRRERTVVRGLDLQDQRGVSFREVTAAEKGETNGRKEKDEGRLAW